MHCKSKNKKRNNDVKNHTFMKKKSLILSALLFFSILPISLFTSCDKDTNCYLDVTVIDEATRVPVSAVAVEVMQDGGNVHAWGITDGGGKYSTHFGAPAIVKIKATLQLYNEAGQKVGQRRGETSVRLVEGETISANITLVTKPYYD